MRLIGEFVDWHKADCIVKMLKSMGIRCVFIHDQKGGSYEVWVVREEDVSRAKKHLSKGDMCTGRDGHITNVEDTHRQNIGQQDSPLKNKRTNTIKPKRSSKITVMAIAVSVALFFIDTSTDNGTGMSPLMKVFCYDYPYDQKSPSWPGLYFIATEWPHSAKYIHANKFVKIKEGELWRLFTPALLHANMLHILFNMLWLWGLGRLVEWNMGGTYYISITLLVAVISNTCQYLMGGPLFIGYSGVVSGLGGFLLAQQRKAPWKWRGLNMSAVRFLVSFILLTSGLQALLFILHILGISNISTPIANTAHISGLLSGILLGYMTPIRGK